MSIATAQADKVMQLATAEASLVSDPDHGVDLAIGGDAQGAARIGSFAVEHLAVTHRVDRSASA